MRFFVTLMLFAAVLIVVALREFNPGMITVNLLPSRSYEVSKSVFFLVSLSFGAGVVFLVYFLRDVKRFLRGLRVQREQKKRSRIQELYTKGLNALLAKRNPEATSFFQKGRDLAVVLRGRLHVKGAGFTTFAAHRKPFKPLAA